MAELEKVIKGLPCLTGVPIYCETCPYSDEFGFGYGNRRCAKECASDALALLKEYQEKQEGLLPAWQDRTQEHICQKCGGIVWQEDNYCSKCGQAVKW